MTLWSLLSFTVAICIAAAIPGPTIVTLVARVLARGRVGAGAFVTGLILGDLFWLACSVFGAVTLATEAHQVMVALKFIGAAYLVYLAFKLWTAPAKALDEAAPDRPSGPRSTGWRAVFGGIAMGLSNPKTMLFYLALVPNLVDMARLNAAGFATLCGVVTVVLTIILASYVGLAGRARHLFRSARAMRRINRGSGVIIAGTALVVATRS
jgi:threonine/homoserine/homoserine lactone efflux protein